MTLEFFTSQLRVFAVALIAYLGGRGIFTPADSTLAIAGVTSLGPIVVPWLFSIYTNYGVKKVPVNSIAIETAPQAATGTPEGPAKTELASVTGKVVG